MVNCVQKGLPLMLQAYVKSTSERNTSFVSSKRHYYVLPFFFCIYDLLK